MVTASAISSSLGSEALLDGGSFGTVRGRFFAREVLLDRAGGEDSFGPCERVLSLIRKSPTTS